MLNSILINKFPSKDQFLLAKTRVHSTSEILQNNRRKTTQANSHGRQPKDGGVFDMGESHLHVNVKHVHFANDCKDDGGKKSTLTGSGCKTSCLLDIVRSNNGKEMFLTPCWKPRLSYLLEMNVNSLKKICAKSPSNKFVYFCENQAPLNIGQGPDYSCTFLGIMNDGTGVAVKKINKKRVDMQSDEGQWRVLASINNPSLAKVWFISSDKTHYYIVRELCEYSIAYHLKMRGFVPLQNRPPLNHEDLCYKIACAVAALHQLALSHKSLKPENIFLTDSGDVKLADYQLHGRCSSKKKQYANVPSSLAWLPSESHTNTPELTLASDVSALGMIFYWIITEGGHPFGDHLHSLDACMKNCKSGRYNLKSLTNPFAHHLLQHMIYKEPEKRLTIDEVVKHPYFWSEDVKIEYLQLMAMTYCGNFEYLWKTRSELKQYLMKKECAIGKSTPKSVKVPIDFNIKDIMRYIYTGMLQNDDSPTKKVLESWPGFVFETYNQFSLDDLKSAQEICIADLNSPFESKESSLKPCLSVDSGVNITCNESSSDMNDPFTCTNGNHFERRQRFISGDSGCCSYSDPGIDLMSPVVDFSKSESCFEFPDILKGNDTASNGSVSGICEMKSLDDLSVQDNFTDDDRIRKNEYLKVSSTNFMLWTDMDELD